MKKVTLAHFQLTPTKGDPRCIFCEYSECVSREPRNSSLVCFSFYFCFVSGLGKQFPGISQQSQGTITHPPCVTIIAGFMQLKEF